MVQGVMAVRTFLILLAITALSGPIRANATGPEHTGQTTAECLACHGVGEFGMAREDGEWIPLFVDEKEFLDSVHGTQECSACHRDMAEGGHRRAAIGDATLRAAMKALKDMPMNQPVALASCVICHETEFEQYRDSVHGRAALAGNADVPVCTDCHGEHYVRAADDLQSTVHPTAVVNTCASCHAGEGIIEQYAVRAEQYYTYRESYHGIAQQYGSATVANCASCHGAHNVRAPSDPMSSVYPGNLPHTCGQCHRWTNPNVAKGKIHVVASREPSALLYYVRPSFKWLTIVVMTALCGHIALDLMRRARRPRSE